MRMDSPFSLSSWMRLFLVSETQTSPLESIATSCGAFSWPRLPVATENVGADSAAASAGVSANASAVRQAAEQTPASACADGAATDARLNQPFGVPRVQPHVSFRAS